MIQNCEKCNKPLNEHDSLFFEASDTFLECKNCRELRTGNIYKSTINESTKNVQGFVVNSVDKAKEVKRKIDDYIMLLKKQKYEDNVCIFDKVKDAFLNNFSIYISDNKVIKNYERYFRDFQNINFILSGVLIPSDNLENEITMPCLGELLKLYGLDTKSNIGSIHNKIFEVS